MATTIKVPDELRNRLAQRAQERHVSQADVIAEALEALERREFWAAVDAGWRPVLVVSGSEYTDHIPGLVLAVPLTTRNRGLPHHVPVGGATTGLQESTWTLCEQVRAISTDRLREPGGTCDEETVAAIRTILRRFLAS